MSMLVLDEGICRRCGKTVTREPGGRWYDSYGRDRCRLDPEDGQCDVPAWHSIELQQSPPLPLSTVTLFGRDAEGRVIALVRQTLPAGAGWQEEFPEPMEVLGWSIKADAPAVPAAEDPASPALLGRSPFTHARRYASRCFGLSQSSSPLPSSSSSLAGALTVARASFGGPSR